MKNVISRVKGSQPAPILLVANKLDLECQREVATSEGKSKTKKNRENFVVDTNFIFSSFLSFFLFFVCYHLLIVKGEN